MCGIVGYSGPKEPLPILINGLSRLEYRGYDSAGIAISDGNKITVEKKEAATENPESIRIDSSHSLRNGPRVDEGEVVNPLHGYGKRKSRRNRKTKKSRKSKTRKNGRKSNRRR